MRRPLMVSLTMAAVMSAMGPFAPAGVTAASPVPSPGSVAGLVEATIPVPGSPDWPTAAFGSIWVLAPDLPTREGTGTPNLVRIDPATNEVVATIELPDRLCQGSVASDDSIWVCAVDALVRVDPATDTITDSVPVELAGLFYRLAFGAGRVWALGTGSFVGDTVVALDPATGSITKFHAGGSVAGLSYAFDALWLTVPASGSVLRLDPATGEIRELVTGLPSPTQITAGSDSLWVTLHGAEEQEARSGDPQVARVDPVSGEVIATFALGGSPKGGLDVLASESGVWVRGTRPWLTRIDPATNAVTATYASEPDIHAIQGPLTEGYGSIWTVNIEEDVVYRLTP